MQTISSAAGTRLARAQHRLDVYPSDEISDPFDPEHGADVDEWVEAATQVGKELIAQGFADMEGE
ncbi:MAG: hypothetical protein ACQEUM_07185 [Pseudomonadota bacterium]